MNEMNISSVDLNLLTVFDAVAREGSATRAASRLNLTQPAVSHALSRLRALFGDDLFVRTPRGLAPTPLAESLAPRVRAALDTVEKLLRPQAPFSPCDSSRTFVIGMSDYAALAVLPELLARLRLSAPGVRLLVRHTNRELGPGMLDGGEAELVVGNFRELPPRFSRELLFMEDFLCAWKSGMPGVRDSLDLDSYLALDHLHVSLRGSPYGWADEALKHLGRERRITVTVGHFLVAPPLLATGGLVATEPRRVIEVFAESFGLAHQRPPFPIRSFAVECLWPRRLDGDPGLTWLRGEIAAMSSGVDPSQGRSPAPVA